MKKIFFCITALFFMLCSDAQSYKKLHDRAILVDTHNDILTTAIDKHYSIDQDLRGKTHSDLARWKKGGVDAEIFSVWCDGLKKDPYAWANLEMDTLLAWVQRNPDKIRMVGTPEELLQAVKEKKLAAMFGVEGGHMIENDLNKLDALFLKARGI